MSDTEVMSRLRGGGRNIEVAEAVKAIIAERDRLKTELVHVQTVNQHMRELIDVAGGIAKLEALLLAKG